MLVTALFGALFIPLNIFLRTSFQVPTPPSSAITIPQRPALPTPLPIVVPSPVFTVTPSPKVSPKPKPTATPTLAAQQFSLQDPLMNAINNYRTSKGLTAVKTDSYTCNFANIRAQEISTSFNHDGFNSRISSKTLPYPSYHMVVENLAMTISLGNVVNMWINSPVHEANLRADVTFGCVGTYGNYYAYEGWKP